MDTLPYSLPLSRFYKLMGMGASISDMDEKKGRRNRTKDEDEALQSVEKFTIAAYDASPKSDIIKLVLTDNGARSSLMH